MLPTIQTNKFPAELFWSDEDEGYIALAPDLPGCSAWGKDEASAIHELRLAIEAWIESAKAAGNPIPTPTDPTDASRFSGKFVVRLPRELHANLARGARKEDVSLNQYVVYLLTDAYAARHIEQQLPLATLGNAAILKPASAIAEGLPSGFQWINVESMPHIKTVSIGKNTNYIGGVAALRKIVTSSSLNPLYLRGWHPNDDEDEHAH